MLASSRSAFAYWLLFAFVRLSFAMTDASLAALECAAVSRLLGSKVSFPLSAMYNSSLSSYYSTQEDALSPSCIVSPTSAVDVAIAVGAITAFNLLSGDSAQFAIRGGGHTPWAGSANIAMGVTIDMRGIKSVSVSSDRTLTSIGAGAKWGDVYTQLDAMNLTVSGGRVAPVGVGGLSLGGGISYFSAQKGFVCDNIVNYEIVLAGGLIVNANKDHNADLWLALKGGSNNFGVVTRFDVITFEQGNFWGGTIYYGIQSAAAQLSAFANFAAATTYDQYSALIMSFYYAAGVGFGVTNHLEYTVPVVNPPCFQPITSIQPLYQSTMRISTLADFAFEQAQLTPNGLRQLFRTCTFVNDLTLLNTIFNLWNTSVAPIQGVAGLVYTLTLEPLPPAITSKSAALGGNSLGLSPSQGALVICLITISWDLPSDDAAIQTVAKSFIDSVNSAAQAAGLFNPYIYLNYADVDQLPIDSYGAQNKAKLQAASKKYDPLGIFQRAVPGGFKLFGP